MNMKTSINSQHTAPRLVIQTLGVIHLARTTAVRFFVVTLAGAAFAAEPAGLTTGGLPNALRAAAAPAGAEEPAFARLASDPKLSTLDTNTPAMREAARIKADLQNLVEKILAAENAAKATSRGSASNYLAELNRVADLITETARSKLGNDGELLKASSELLKTINDKMDDLVAKSRDPKNPELANDYDKLVQKLKAAKDALVSARNMTDKCRKDLLAEAERLRSVSGFLADAAAIDAYTDAANAYDAALRETTAFTARLKASIDGLLSRAAMTAPAALE